MSIKLIGDLSAEFDAEFEKLKEQTRNALKRAGEKYVQVARTSKRAPKEYEHHTHNLQQSNSYSIKEEGVIINEPTGMPQTAEIFKNQPMQGDIMLTAGAGMDYASFVQRLGFDVTDAGQLAAENEARRLLGK